MTEQRAVCLACRHGLWPQRPPPAAFCWCTCHYEALCWLSWSLAPPINNPLHSALSHIKVLAQLVIDYCEPACPLGRDGDNETRVGCSSGGGAWLDLRDSGL